jgi:hypothetical protein
MFEALYQNLALDVRKITKDLRIAGLSTETETERLPNQVQSFAATLTCSVWLGSLGQQTVFVAVPTWMNKSICRLHTSCFEAESGIKR